MVTVMESFGVNRPLALRYILGTFKLRSLVDMYAFQLLLDV